MLEIHPSAVVDKTVEFKGNVKIGPNCVIGKGTSIGDDCIFQANVVVGENVKIGSGNRFFAFSIIGGRPQILAMNPDEPVGGLVIGDNNVIREQATIHPSMYKDQFTKIGNDNFLMIGVHIGHDCVLEDKMVLSNYVQVSGHCKVETGVWLSGMVLIHQFVTIGKWCYAAGMTGINHDVPPFLIISGHYPPEVRGVNERGLTRAGLNEKQQKLVFQTYKKLYRNDGPLLKNAQDLAQQDGIDENVRAMLDNIINSAKHRYGRYLETFRH
ncbi:MAG: acyl-ACP--UDP-N-acetylglucosamine O-acyltransferase [Phycisphaerae bacterium]